MRRRWLTIGLTLAALARADALRIPRFEQAIGPDEWPIASVRGVGGSLLYFVDAATREAMWTHEFPHPIESPDAAAMLTGVDHMSALLTLCI